MLSWNFAIIRSAGSISANSIQESEANPILRARSRKPLSRRYFDNSSGPMLRAERHVCVALLLQKILACERAAIEIRRV